MVSKAKELLPEPEMPVTTVRVSRGMVTSTLFRLCSPFSDKSAASMIFSFSKYSPPSNRYAPSARSRRENQRTLQRASLARARTFSSSKFKTAYSLSRMLRKIFALRNM